MALTPAERVARHDAGQRKAGRRPMTIYLPDQMADWIVSEAKRAGINRHQFVEAALRGQYIASLPAASDADGEQ